MNVKEANVSITNGRLACPYELLEAFLGLPNRYDKDDDWESGDKKIRAIWLGNHQTYDGGDSILLNLYDYKAGHVPVEQLDNWSVANMAPSDQTLLLRSLRLKQQNYVGGRGDIDFEPDFGTLLDVQEWFEVFEDEEVQEQFPLPEWLEKLSEALPMRWEEFTSRVETHPRSGKKMSVIWYAKLGLVDEWLVQYVWNEEVAYAIYWNTKSGAKTKTYTIK